MKPTLQEYTIAKKIVEEYEKELKRIEDLNLERFKEELSLYFKNNLLDGHIKINDFVLQFINNSLWNFIYIKPNIDGYYMGENDKDINELCKKYNVKYKFPYWYYSK